MSSIIDLVIKRHPQASVGLGAFLGMMDFIKWQKKRRRVATEWRKKKGWKR